MPAIYTLKSLALPQSRILASREDYKLNCSPARMPRCRASTKIRNTGSISMFCAIRTTMGVT